MDPDASPSSEMPRAELALPLAVDGSDRALAQASIREAQALLNLASRRAALAEVFELFASAEAKLGAPARGRISFKASFAAHFDGDEFEAECLVGGKHPYAEESAESEALYDAANDLRGILNSHGLAERFRERKAFARSGAAWAISRPEQAAPWLLWPGEEARWRADFERRALASSAAPAAPAKGRPSL